mmetsp:Transcript_26383/g.78334  ORF Transcript_26383/g.78334 Transcript_26383/m.78334 type:complete len:305 (+) Transcript_26383:1032-1946(+)
MRLERDCQRQRDKRAEEASQADGERRARAVHGLLRRQQRRGRVHADGRDQVALRHAQQHHQHEREVVGVEHLRQHPRCRGDHVAEEHAGGDRGARHAVGQDAEGRRRAVGPRPKRSQLAAQEVAEGEEHIEQRNEEVSVQAPAGRVGGARRNERGVARRADERRDARVDGHGHAEAAEERGAVDVERVAALPAAALLRVVRLHTHDRCARVLRTRAARGACDGGVALHHRQQRLLVILVYHHELALLGVVDNPRQQQLVAAVRKVRQRGVADDARGNHARRGGEVEERGGSHVLCGVRTRVAGV